MELDRILTGTAAARDSLVTRAKRPPHTKPRMGSFHSEAIIVGRTKDIFVVIFCILFDVKYSVLCRVCRDAGYMRVYTGGRSMSVRAGRD